MRRCRIKASIPIVCAGSDRDCRCRRWRAATPIRSTAPCVSITQIHGGDTWNVIPETRRAARHGAQLQARGAGRDRGGDAPHRPGRRGGDGRQRSMCTTTGAIRPPSTARPRPSVAADAAVGGRRRRPRSSATCSRPWARRILPSCCASSPAAISSSATARSRQRRAAQPALRFQRRHPADRRQLLGDAGRARAGAAV